MVKRIREFVSSLVNEERGHYVLLGLFALVAHGLLLLNDGVYWDGWLIYAAKFLDRWDLTYGIYAYRGGVPVYTVFHWLLYQFPFFVFGYKLGAFLFLSTSAIFIYRIARLLTKNGQISLWIALVALTYPANQAIVELIVIPYLLSYFQFWLGCLLLVLAYKKGKSAIWWHLAAGVSLLLSFRMYSLLAYFYGFLLILFAVWWSERKKESFFKAVLSFVRAYAGYIVLPIFFWLANAVVFPPSGPYAESDAFFFNPVVLSLAETYFTIGLAGQLAESLANLANPPLLLVVGIVGGLAAWVAGVDKTAKEWAKGSKLWWLIGLGAALFVAGLFPYVIVGRSLQLHGWATRNAVLIAVPVAMLLVGLVWTVVAKFGKGRAVNQLARIAVFVVAAMVTLFTVETVKFYLNWQLRAIKDQSVIVNFEKQSEFTEGVSVFQVFDNFRVGGETKYRPHEYFGMFALAMPDSEKIGFDVNYYSYEDYFLTGDEVHDRQLDFWYPNLDEHGCQAEMHINVGSAEMEPLLFLRYFYYRYFKPDKLDSFLSTITKLEFAPFDSEYATNCSR